MKLKKLFALFAAAAIAAVNAASIQSGVVFAQEDVTVIQAEFYSSAEAYLSAASSDTFVGTSYYEQLDQLSKDIYDILYEAYKDGGNGDTHDVIAAFEKNEATVYEYDTTEEIQSVIFKSIEEDVKDAYVALAYDHPELSWISYTSRTVSPTASNYTSSKYIKLSEVSFCVNSGYEYGTAEEMEAAVEKAAAEIEYSNVRYEMAVNIHDYICENVAYNYTAASESVPDGYDIGWYQTAYSAFYPIESNNQLDDAADNDSVLTVCAGYARAFKILCDYYGIPCVIISGNALEEAHAWNYVQMEDGNWYAVDATWDDTGESDTYFLAGSGTASSIKNDEGVYYTFIETHTPSAIADGFSVPVLSESKYVYDPGADSTDNENNDNENNDDDDDDDDTDFLLGDLDGSGKVDSWDSVLLARYLANWGISIDRSAADLDGDGEVTLWDSVLLARKVAGWKS